MRGLSDLHRDPVPVRRHIRNMLLLRRVGDVGLKLLHRLAAADDRNAAVHKLHNYVAAMLTSVKYHILSFLAQRLSLPSLYRISAPGAI